MTKQNNSNNERMPLKFLNRGIVEPSNSNLIGCSGIERIGNGEQVWRQL